VSVPKDIAINLGGFDTNFVKVAYHYEAEFAYRWRRNGLRIIYQPKALLQHLKAERGGTRSYGLHLTTTKPDHAVGRYYFNFSTKPLSNAIVRSVKDLIKSILTKHHIRKPLWIPLTLIAELRGLLWAILLYSTGRGLINGQNIDLLVIASHPVQYMSQIFQSLNLSVGLSTRVLYLTIPDSKSQSLGFKQEFLWDVPLLEGYEYVEAQKSPGRGLASGFTGVRVDNPLRELKRTYRPYKPDVVLLTGWHFWGMIQMFFSLILSDIPIILRMDSNGLKKRSFLHRKIYEIFFSYIKICLTVGKANELFCINNGMHKNQLIQCPHIVNNDFFLKLSSEARLDREQIRHEWGIPKDAFCFIFAGKLQPKKNPLDLLQAFEQAYKIIGANIYLLIVGTGELEDECIRYATSGNLPVSFTGFLNQTQIPKSYAVSDCIVLPSNDDETWGLVINEAMACGLPAIVSDQAGCAGDLIRNGVTGYEYKCGDINQLKSLLIHIYEDRQSAKVMGKNAKRLIFEEYNLRSVISGIEEGVSCIHGPLEGMS
jgi:glycosyltransferase involved in cell wall biosynthesis